MWKTERESGAGERGERKRNGGGQLFFFSAFDLDLDPHLSSISPPKTQNTPARNNKNSPRRLRGPLNGGHGRRLDGHGVSPGRGQGL